jgi:hypothetical protein
MRTNTRTVSVAAIFLLAAGFAFAQNPPGQDPPSRVARLNMISGPVSFQPASVDDWTNATLNYPMTTGDHLYADVDARAEMHVGPNAIRLNSRTNFGFLNLDDRTAQIRLTEGAIHIRLRSLLDSDIWEIDTPNGAISLLRTGDYRIDTDPGRNATMVTVIAGEAEATANGQATPIHSGQTAYFAGDSPQADIRSANAPDEFDQFCWQRDRREDSAPAPRYVSREMVGYEDLDANGVWTEAADYGPIWRPRVAVGWAPYHNGHWAWVEPWGWTWIDAAPWGFAPFHYGRWVYAGGGWGWCPGPRVVVARPVYAPALVAFVGGAGWSVSLRLGGGGGVAWFPLGYNEPYIPAYHVSPAYVRQVNVTNVTYINNVTINNVVNNYNRPGYVNETRYSNQVVRGAVTAVPRQAFISSQSVQRTAVVVPAGSFDHERVGGYTAAIAPERQSILRASQGNVPRPDAAIVNRQVVARNPPPPAAVPFAARQEALQSNGGRPLAPQQLQTIRQTSSVSEPPVRIAGRPAPQALPQNAPPANRMQPNQPEPNRAQPIQPATPATRSQPPQDRMSSRPPAVVEREQQRPPAAVQQQQRVPAPQAAPSQPQPERQARPQPAERPQAERPQTERPPAERQPVSRPPQVEQRPVNPRPQNEQPVHERPPAEKKESKPAEKKEVKNPER